MITQQTELTHPSTSKSMKVKTSPKSPEYLSETKTSKRSISQPSSLENKVDRTPNKGRSQEKTVTPVLDRNPDLALDFDPLDNTAPVRMHVFAFLAKYPDIFEQYGLPKPEMRFFGKPSPEGNHWSVWGTQSREALDKYHLVLYFEEGNWLRGGVNYIEEDLNIDFPNWLSAREQNQICNRVSQVTRIPHPVERPRILWNDIKEGRKESERWTTRLKIDYFEVAMEDPNQGLPFEVFIKMGAAIGRRFTDQNSGFVVWDWEASSNPRPRELRVTYDDVVYNFRFWEAKRVKIKDWGVHRLNEMFLPNKKR